LFSAGNAFPEDVTSSNSLTNSPDSAQSEKFKQPRTLSELLALNPDQLEKVDVALIDLLCAEGLRGSENLDVQSCLDRLDAWALHIEQETKRNFHRFAENPQDFNNSLPYYRMGMLGTILAEDLGIKYDPDREEEQLQSTNGIRSRESWNAFFGDSRDVFIHGLLYGKHYGTCSSMPFLYVAIGRRLGYPVTIAARKYHLYARYGVENGEHLNIEATENRGFATPTDDEYRNGPFPMTDEEIKSCGWLRPLNNKEILGICLLTRSGVLRSAKRYNDEVVAIDQAARYLPENPLMKRALEQNRSLAFNLHAAARWDLLWDKLENLSLPTGGPQYEHFKTRREQIRFAMNESTNLAEIENDVKALNDELARYVGKLADDRSELAEAFGSAKPPANQQVFLSLFQRIPQMRRVVLPREQVPPEYYQNGIPPTLMARLQKLTTRQEMIVEMNAYYGDEINLRNHAIKGTMNQAAVQSRRMELDQEPLTQAPLEIEFAPSILESAPPIATNLPLTIEPQTPMNISTNGKGKQ